MSTNTVFFFIKDDSIERIMLKSRCDSTGQWYINDDPCTKDEAVKYLSATVSEQQAIDLYQTLSDFYANEVADT